MRTLFFSSPDGVFSALPFSPPPPFSLLSFHKKRWCPLPHAGKRVIFSFFPVLPRFEDGVARFFLRDGKISSFPFFSCFSCSKQKMAFAVPIFIPPFPFSFDERRVVTCGLRFFFPEFVLLLLPSTGQRFLLEGKFSFFFLPLSPAVAADFLFPPPPLSHEVSRSKLDLFPILRESFFFFSGFCSPEASGYCPKLLPSFFPPPSEGRSFFVFFLSFDAARRRLSAGTRPSFLSHSSPSPKAPGLLVLFFFFL